MAGFMFVPNDLFMHFDFTIIFIPRGLKSTPRNEKRKINRTKHIKKNTRVKEKKTEISSNLYKLSSTLEISAW